MRYLSRRRGLRRFDPVAVGQHETNAWVLLLPARVADLPAGLRRDGRVGLPHVSARHPRRRVVGAARESGVVPYPDNDPDAARDFMRRFYALVRDSGVPLDPGEAAYREVEWWRVHRVHQRESGATEEDIVEALVDLYSYVYRTDRAPMVPAAQHRVEAMRLSDAWVLGGCQLDDPVLATERRELVASYTALRDAVDRAWSVSPLRTDLLGRT